MENTKVRLCSQRSYLMPALNATLKPSNYRFTAQQKPCMHNYTFINTTNNYV